MTCVHVRVWVWVWVCVEIKGQLVKDGPFLHHLDTWVVRFDVQYLCVQLDFKSRPCLLSHPLPSTPARHRPQKRLGIQQHTHADRHFESPGSLASQDMQAFLETSLAWSPHVPPTSGQAHGEGILRPDPPPCPHSQNDIHSISNVCPVTDLSLRLDSLFSPN